MKREMRKRKLFSCLVLLAFTVTAMADWDPGDSCKMHFPQNPDPQGWDICLNHAIIADDFMCTETGPITDVHFWVSWQQDYARWDLIESIGITFYADAGNQPGAPLKAYTILPSDPGFVYRWYGMGVQGWHCPQTQFTQYPDHQNFYQINLKPLAEPWFNQIAQNRYWLGIVIHMLPDGDPDPSNDPQIGWKTALTSNHWGDFSKWNLGGPWLNVMPEGLVRDQAFVVTNDAAQGSLDFGDAPDQPYPTLLINDGARHKVLPGMFLGATLDTEPDGQPTVPADGDDLNPPAAPDDEDGVVFTTPLVVGQMASVDVIASMPGLLDAWIDFDNNGFWSIGLPEEIFASQPLAAGLNTLTFQVPASAIVGPTYARFRFSSTGGLAPTGIASDGEVEDYFVRVDPYQEPDELDFGDAPDPTYPTLLASNGASHVIRGPWLGDFTDAPDPEVDGSPSPIADGDDVFDGNDDEDGVLIPVLTEGVGGMLSVTVNNMLGGGGVVQIWIDWNQDGTWTHPIEQVFSGFLPIGPSPVPVAPPLGSAGQTFLRARISMQGGLLPTGPAVDGEVEDYPVTVEKDIRYDFGDAPDSPQAPGYPTLLANNGARHIIGGPWLGGANDAPDAEADGQPTALADGDDNNAIDDENGVMIPTLYQGMPATIQFQISGGGGIMEFWIDYNQNRIWEPAELVYATFYPDGNYSLNTIVPITAQAGQTFARFRISTAGTAQATGPAADGEVEDYAVIIREGPKNDLGDAPDSSNASGGIMRAYPGVQANFPTVFAGPAPIGPRHLAPLSDAFFGNAVSLENEADVGMDTDSVNNINPAADANDLDGADDGLIVPVKMPNCKKTHVDFMLNVPTTGTKLYYVNIWCDWNRDGDWNDLISAPCGDIPEWAVRNQMFNGVLSGITTWPSLPFVSWHPADGPAALWMRMTVSEQPWMQIWGAGGCGPVSGYAFGETEDYLVIPDTSCTECADLNCDKFVNLADFAIFASQWLTTCP